MERRLAPSRDDETPRPLLVRFDVSRAAPDLGTVEILARLELTLKREGWRVELAGSSAELRELLALCGIPFRLALEAERLAEEREESRRVEEERDPADPLP